MDLGIAGKWALVGGASKGLGWGCARALALEGVNVVMVARGAEVLNKAVDELRAETIKRMETDPDKVVEELLREIRPLRIYEGASEVQKLIIARQVLSGAGAT